MRKLEPHEMPIPFWKVIFVTTSIPDYSMDRTIVVEDWPHQKELLHGHIANYTVLHGEHCSCYDFDEIDYWDAIVYTRDELIKVADGWRTKGEASEQLLASMLLNYL